MKKILPLLFFVVLLSGCSNKEDALPDAPVNFVVPATEDIIMYEINIGSFSNGGDLNGITARLDKIQALGINTIWLMPIYPIGTLNSFGSPYCVKNYFGINPEMGGLEDLKALIEEAHKRDIAVILDWVANHTSWDNPWITEHPEWYTQNAAGTIISPLGTNWNDVADLNYSNSDMRLEMISAMEYWITEVGVDGFRCDAADFVPFDFWQQAITSLKDISGRNIILLAEGSREDHFAAGFQMNFAWDWYTAVKNVFVSNGSPETLYNTHLSEYTSVPTGKRKLRFTTNHDLSNQLTPIGVFGTKKAALAASVATLLMNSTPLIYSGQEVGVSAPSIYTSGQTINWNLNPDMLSAYTALLQFYKNSEVSRKGVLTNYTNSDFIVFKKTLGDSKILVLINSRSSAKTLLVHPNLQGSWVNALNNQPLLLTENISLNGYEYLILKEN